MDDNYDRLMIMEDDGEQKINLDQIRKEIIEQMDSSDDEV